MAVINVTPASGPSSTATTNLVNTIRNDRQTLTAGTHANLAVTGTTALNIDVANTMSSAMLPYLALIVVLAFLVLAIAFQSLLIPLIAVGGFLLSSIAATLWFSSPSSKTAPPPACSASTSPHPSSA